MPKEKQLDTKEEKVVEEEDDRIKLTELLSAILEFHGDSTNEEKYDRVQNMIESITVRERLTIMEKELALVEILNALPEEDKGDAASETIDLELGRYFHGLLKYATNLNIDLNYSLLDIAVYDALEAFGLGDYLRKYCGKDYSALCGLVNDALNFRNIDKIVGIAALFSDENMKSFKETVNSLKTELTPERLAQMKAIVAEGDPAWTALKETVTEQAVENALVMDTQKLEEEDE